MDRIELESKSKFTGGILGFIGIGLLKFFLILFTLGIATPWAVCMSERWWAKHTYIEGKRLVFKGKGIQLFGRYILWWFLTIITLGIYLFWLQIAMKKWVVKHTYFVPDANLDGQNQDETNATLNSEYETEEAMNWREKMKDVVAEDGITKLSDYCKRWFIGSSLFITILMLVRLITRICEMILGGISFKFLFVGSDLFFVIISVALALFTIIYAIQSNTKTRLFALIFSLFSILWIIANYIWIIDSFWTRCFISFVWCWINYVGAIVFLFSSISLLVFTLRSMKVNKSEVQD